MGDSKQRVRSKGLIVRTSFLPAGVLPNQVEAWMRSVMPHEHIPVDHVRHRRHLPHWQYGGSTYFVTFRSLRGELPAVAKSKTLEVASREHNWRCYLHLALLMPDHAHLILSPLEVKPGLYHGLGKIMKGIKGTSAREINKLLGTSGPVWQDESYDHMIRDSKEFRDTWNYVWLNPVRKELCKEIEDYPFVVFNIEESWWADA